MLLPFLDRCCILALSRSQPLAFSLPAKLPVPLASVQTLGNTMAPADHTYYSIPVLPYPDFPVVVQYDMLFHATSVVDCTYQHSKPLRHSLLPSRSSLPKFCQVCEGYVKHQTAQR